jgi:positive phototaxis protein PixI
MTKIAAPPHTRNFLSFSVDAPVAGLLPAGQLLEVLAVAIDEIMPISGMPEAVMGVCNWRGEVLWLVDFSVALQTERLCDRGLLLPQYNVLIAQSDQGPVGLVVQTVGQMQWIDPIEIYPAPTAQPGLQGYWKSPDGAETFALLNLDHLLQNLSA